MSTAQAIRKAQQEKAEREREAQCKANGHTWQYEANSTIRTCETCYALEKTPESSFCAGTSFEPLASGGTRIKTFAQGGALVSDEVTSTEEAVKRIQTRNLPGQVIVEPHLAAIDEERDMVDGHTIKAGGHIFIESGADRIYYQQSSKIRAWLSKYGYKHQRDLENTYMATAGLHGVYGKGEL